MIIIYSQPAYGVKWEITPIRLRYLSPQRIAEYASKFAAENYTNVWLVPGTEAE